LTEETRKLRGQLLAKSQRKGGNDKDSRGLALSLVDLLDRIQRMEKSAEVQFKKGWSGAFSAQKYVKKQIEALSIFTEYLNKCLSGMQVEPIEITKGDGFDPMMMKAVGKLESGHLKSDKPTELVVSEELLKGYVMGNQCLRTSEVTLAKKIKANE